MRSCSRIISILAVTALGCAGQPAGDIDVPVTLDTDTASHPAPEPAPLVEIVVERQQSDVPDSFPQADEFADLATACTDMVPRLVARAEWHAAIRDWCLARAWASSRNGQVRSRIDGSWVHDRDRPVAKSFYLAGLRAGVIDPDACPLHRVDTSIRRTRAAAAIVERWPYGTHCDRRHGECRPGSPGRMLEHLADRWLRREVDYERFGTRGPMDNHFATAARYLDGCFGPEQLDRYDVAAAVVIERAEALCEQLDARLNTRAKRAAAKSAGLPPRCRHHRDLREIWSQRFWSVELPAALSRSKQAEVDGGQ